MSTYNKLFTITVMKTPVGNWFVYGDPNEPNAAAAKVLQPLEDFSHCRFVVQNAVGENSVTYYVAGNNYDHDVIFSPETPWWFAKGATRTLTASDFQPGDTITVETRWTVTGESESIREIHQRVFAHGTWILLTQSAGSGYFFDWKQFRSLMKPNRG